MDPIVEQDAPVVTELSSDPSGEPSAQSPVEGSQPGETAPSKLDLIREALDSGELDPREFIKSHPKLASAYGDLGERRAQELFAAADSQKRQAELDRIAQQRLEEDPDDPLAQERLQAARREAEKTNATWLAEYLGDEGMKEYQESPELAHLRGQAVNPLEFLKAVTGIRDKQVEARIAAEVKRRLPAEVEARVKERLGESLGTEPSPDRGGGSPASGSLTRERYLSMPFEERRKLQLEHPEQIPNMAAA